MQSQPTAAGGSGYTVDFDAEDLYPEHASGEGVPREEAMPKALGYFDGDGMRATKFLDKYALSTSEGVFFELTPDDMHKRLSSAFAAVEQSFGGPRQLGEQELFEYFKDFQYLIPNGSPMAAIGNPFQAMSLSNCLVVGNQADSYAGIMTLDEELAQLMKRRAGVGTDISHLRPSGQPVHNAARTSTGAASFMNRFSQTTGEVAQSGRRGALMLTISIAHPDSEEFIDKKLEDGEVTNANVSVKATDEFIEAALSGETFIQRFPIDASPEEAEVTREVDAARLWRKIAENAHESAEPGLLFWDRIKGESPADEYADVGFDTISTNPCVAGDTLIATDEGLLRADVLAQRGQQSVVTDSRLDPDNTHQETTAQGVYQTGVRPVVEVKTSEGYELRLTKDHRVMTEDGWTKAGELSPDDEVHVRRQAGGHGSKGSAELGRVLGWFVGDGFISESDNRACLDFYGSKMSLGEQFADDVSEVVRESVNDRDYSAEARQVSESQLRIRSNRLYEIAETEGLTYDKLRVPEAVLRGTKEMQRGFLRGIFSADGGVQGSPSNGVTVRLSSVDKDLLKQVQQLLLNFEVYSSLYEDRKEPQMKELPDQQGGHKEYQTQGFHDLAIAKKDLLRFRDRVGFLLEEKQESLKDSLSEYVRSPYKRHFTAEVTSVEHDGIEPVYDLTENFTSSFTGNSLVTHNCGEASPRRVTAADCSRSTGLALSRSRSPVRPRSTRTSFTRRAAWPSA
jgi:ribonucleoside-diphosphate reductase alpha chain